MLTFSILLSVTFMVILLGGWSGNGLIATLGAILASFSLALRVASLLRPDSFPVFPYPRPPTLPPSPPTGSSPPAREKVETCTLQHARDDDIRWLENLSDQVRELRMAILPAEGETAEVLWDML
ncbi:Ff.00g105210.m01.CDS01 [Fusarium sp. VM40]|nr:Ff.00g105210.m01.CDS01 [Fusarium sp. VM40]